jgi:hypothetical protein
MLDINKIKTVEECDKLILQLLQESYKFYLNGKFNEGKKHLGCANRLMARSKSLQQRERNKKIILERRKRAKEKKEEPKIIEDTQDSGEHFKGISHDG